MFHILIVLAALAQVHQAVLASQEVCKECVCREGGVGMNPDIYFWTFEDEDVACVQLCTKTC